MIPSLDLNLSTRPFRNNTLPWIGLVLGIGLLGLLTWWNATTYIDYNERFTSLNARLGSYEAEMEDLRLRGMRSEQGIKLHNIKSLRVQAAKANDVIELKAFSWTRLFNRMEGILPYEVRMGTVRPMFRLGSRRSDTAEAEEDGIPIMVEGTAKSLQAFLELERNLLDDPYFDRVEPEMHVQKEDSQEQLFKIKFYYYPGEGPAEEEATAEDAEAEVETAGARAEEGEEVEG